MRHRLKRRAALSRSFAAGQECKTCHSNKKQKVHLHHVTVFNTLVFTSAKTPEKNSIFCLINTFSGGQVTLCCRDLGAESEEKAATQMDPLAFVPKVIRALGVSMSLHVQSMTGSNSCELFTMSFVTEKLPLSSAWYIEVIRRLSSPFGSLTSTGNWRGKSERATIGTWLVWTGLDWLVMKCHLSSMIMCRGCNIKNSYVRISVEISNAIRV